MMAVHVILSCSSAAVEHKVSGLNASQIYADAPKITDIDPYQLRCLK